MVNREDSKATIWVEIDDGRHRAVRCCLMGLLGAMAEVAAERDCSSYRRARVVHTPFLAGHALDLTGKLLLPTLGAVG